MSNVGVFIHKKCLACVGKCLFIAPLCTSFFVQMAHLIIQIDDSCIPMQSLCVFIDKSLIWTCEWRFRLISVTFFWSKLNILMTVHVCALIAYISNFHSILVVGQILCYQSSSDLLWKIKWNRMIIIMNQ